MDVVGPFLARLEETGHYFVNYQDGILIELAFDDTVGRHHRTFTDLEQTAADLEKRLRSHQTQALLLASKIHAYDASPSERVTQMMSIYSFFATHRLVHPLNAYSTALLISRLDATDAQLQRTVDLYRLVKDSHRFIVSPLLMSFLFLNSLRRGELTDIHDQIESTYAVLKKQFGRSQQTYVTALLLSLVPVEDHSTYIDQLTQSRNLYRKQGIPLSFHGLLALLGDPRSHQPALQQMTEQLRHNSHFKYRKDLVFLTAVRLYVADHPTLHQLFGPLSPSNLTDSSDFLPVYLFPVDLTDTSHATDGGMADGGFDGGDGGGSGGD
ncbi:MULTISPECIES: DUF4003 family protein [Exiguobacterium]|uniref:DUF4003 family protein n=1 Tax=Exiguobacterium TaxID=33986 RepID=UPI00047DC986|nr:MULTISPECIES: DUF4003 family protein [Exiguobacterium]MCT4779780.1 DUF4003 domain-containing protein [Exiguobacterium soli]